MSYGISDVKVWYANCLVLIDTNTACKFGITVALIRLRDAFFEIDRKFINILNPTGHVMHHQFNIQQLYALPTLYLCVLYLSENKQRLVPLTA